MAYYLKQQANRIDYSIREYVADTVAEIVNLPVDDAPGSTCFVIDGSRTFMLNNKGQWKEVFFGSGGGGGGSTGPASIEISSQDGNILQELPDGYYVPESSVKISADAGNILKEHTDGLFVPSLELQKSTLTPLVEEIISNSMETEDIDFSVL